LSHIRIVSPSLGRSNRVQSHLLLPGLEYVVQESEEEEYRAAGVDNLWVCPNEVYGIATVRNWILDNADAERLVVVDDDISKIGRWTGNLPRELSPEEVIENIEMGFQLAEEFGVRLWGMNLIPDKGAYREFTPFSLNNMVLGPFQAFILPVECRFDEELFLKEDYDFCVQMLNRYRKILRVNYLYYVADHHKAPGGVAQYRTVALEKQHMAAFRKKWGSKIVKQDLGKRGSYGGSPSRSLQYDLNPIVKAPIRGI